MSNNNKNENLNEASEPEALGWDAITNAFEKLYPNRTNPLHYGTLIKYNLGGNDPLDGISIYDGGDYWHFITYGFSEVYEKESENMDVSGWGFELTLKLKKAGLDEANLDAELKNLCGVLQGLARYVFNSGAVFRPNEYIYTKQTRGMDVSAKSKITGFITKLDEAGEIETPNGKLTFVQLIGATDFELRSIVDKKVKVSEILEKFPDLLTDYSRNDLEI